MNKVKSILLGSTMLVYPAVKISAQVNPAKAEIQKIIATEFQKADIEPTDMYISEKELQKYAENNSVKITDFDMNGDSLLNIDEFKQFIIGGKPAKINNKSNNVSKVNNTFSTPIKKVKTKSELVKESHEINKALQYYLSNDGKAKRERPGILWGTNTYYDFQDDKILETVQKIDADNFEYVLGDKKLSLFYKSTLHMKLRSYGEGSLHYDRSTMNKYCTQICAHLGKVLDDYATKHLLHTDELDVMINSIKGGNSKYMDAAVKYMYIKQ